MPSRRRIAGWRCGFPTAACLLLAAGCGGSSKHARPVARPGGRPPLISIFEAPSQLASDPGGTLGMLRQLGVDYVRVSVPWAAVAPDAGSLRAPTRFAGSSPGAYHQSGWAPYDAIINAARARGIGVDLDAAPPAPRWATGGGEPAGGPPGLWKPETAPFGAFVQALGTRYSGHYTPAGAASPLPRVSFWSIWNEPNYGSDLAPQAIDNSTVEFSPILYRQLVDAAWSGLEQTGHGHDTVLIGELAPSGITGPRYPGNFSGMVPLRFVRALYCVDQSLHPLTGAAAAVRRCPTTPAGVRRFPAQHPALFHASGFAVHPYSQGALAPNLLTPNEPDFSNLAALPHLGQTLDTIQAAYGSSTHFPLYSTEYGYKTNPPYVAGAPPDVAAAYLNWAEYLSWLDPRIRSFDQYLLSDPPASTGSRFDNGLEFANGSPKPSFLSFRLPIYVPVTSGRRDGSIEVWGCLRPARYALGPDADHGRIEFSPSATGPFRTVEGVTVSAQDCYFDVSARFPSSGFVRLSWTYPHGATIHSRVVAVTLS